MTNNSIMYFNREQYGGWVVGIKFVSGRIAGLELVNHKC